MDNDTEYERTRKYLKGKLPMYLRSKSININGRFKCLNPEHHDTERSMHYEKQTHTVICTKCNARYDIFDVVGILNKLNSFNESFNKVHELYIGPVPDELNRVNPQPKSTANTNRNFDSFMDQRSSLYFVPPLQGLAMPQNASLAMQQNMVSPNNQAVMQKVINIDHKGAVTEVQKQNALRQTNHRMQQNLSQYNDQDNSRFTGILTNDRTVQGEHMFSDNAQQGQNPSLHSSEQGNRRNNGNRLDLARSIASTEAAFGKNIFNPHNTPDLSRLEPSFNLPNRIEVANVNSFGNEDSFKGKMRAEPALNQIANPSLMAMQDNSLNFMPPLPPIESNKVLSATNPQTTTTSTASISLSDIMEDRKGRTTPSRYSGKNTTQPSEKSNNTRPIATHTIEINPLVEQPAGRVKSKRANQATSVNQVSANTARSPVASAIAAAQSSFTTQNSFANQSNQQLNNANFAEGSNQSKANLSDLARGVVPNTNLSAISRTGLQKANLSAIARGAQQMATSNSVSQSQLEPSSNTPNFFAAAQSSSNAQAMSAQHNQQPAQRSFNASQAALVRDPALSEKVNRAYDKVWGEHEAANRQKQEAAAQAAIEKQKRHQREEEFSRQLQQQHYQNRHQYTQGIDDTDDSPYLSPNQNIHDFEQAKAQRQAEQALNDMQFVSGNVEHDLPESIRSRVLPPDNQNSLSYDELKNASPYKTGIPTLGDTGALHAFASQNKNTQKHGSYASNATAVTRSQLPDEMSNSPIAGMMKKINGTSNGSNNNGNSRLSKGATTAALNTSTPPTEWKQVFGDAELPLLNPTAPSTLINGRSYNFEQMDQHTLRSNIEKNLASDTARINAENSLSPASLYATAKGRPEKPSTHIYGSAVTNTNQEEENLAAHRPSASDPYIAARHPTSTFASVVAASTAGQLGESTAIGTNGTSISAIMAASMAAQMANKPQDDGQSTVIQRANSPQGISTGIESTAGLSQSISEQIRREQNKNKSQNEATTRIVGVINKVEPQQPQEQSTRIVVTEHTNTPMLDELPPLDTSNPYSTTIFSGVMKDRVMPQRKANDGNARKAHRGPKIDFSNTSPNSTRTTETSHVVQIDLTNLEDERVSSLNAQSAKTGDTTSTPLNFFARAQDAIDNPKLAATATLVDEYPDDPHGLMGNKRKESSIFNDAEKSSSQFISLSKETTDEIDQALARSTATISAVAAIKAASDSLDKDLEKLGLKKATDKSKPDLRVSPVVRELKSSLDSLDKILNSDPSSLDKLTADFKQDAKHASDKNQHDNVQHNSFSLEPLTAELKSTQDASNHSIFAESNAFVRDADLNDAPLIKEVESNSANAHEVHGQNSQPTSHDSSVSSVNTDSMLVDAVAKQELNEGAQSHQTTVIHAENQPHTSAGQEYLAASAHEATHVSTTFNAQPEQGESWQKDIALVRTEDILKDPSSLPANTRVIKNDNSRTPPALLSAANSQANMMQLSPHQNTAISQLPNNGQGPMAMPPNMMMQNGMGMPMANPMLSQVAPFGAMPGQMMPLPPLGTMMGQMPNALLGQMPPMFGQMPQMPNQMLGNVQNSLQPNAMLNGQMPMQGQMVTSASLLSQMPPQSVSQPNQQGVNPVLSQQIQNSLESNQNAAVQGTLAQNNAQNNALNTTVNQDSLEQQNNAQGAAAVSQGATMFQGTTVSQSAEAMSQEASVSQNASKNETSEIAQTNAIQEQATSSESLNTQLNASKENTALQDSNTTNTTNLEHAQNLKQQALEFWVQQKGLSAEIVERFNLGFTPQLPVGEQVWQAGLIPLSENSQQALNVQTGQVVILGQNAPCFNLAVLEQSAEGISSAVFIVSSPLDALCLESLGAHAVALTSPDNVNYLLEYLQERVQYTLSFYISLERNGSWSGSSERLIRGFNTLQLPFKQINLAEPYDKISISFSQDRSDLLNRLQSPEVLNSLVISPERHAQEAATVQKADAIDQALNTEPINQIQLLEVFDPMKDSGLILSTESLAKLQLANVLYTMTTSSVAVSRLILSSVILNQEPILFAGSKMQWQMICNRLAALPAGGVLGNGGENNVATTNDASSGIAPQPCKARLVELPLEFDTKSLLITLTQAVMTARNSLPDFANLRLMLDTYSFEERFCAALAPLLAELALSLNLPIMVWCTNEQKSYFEGQSIQTIEMSKGMDNEILFKTLDEDCHLHTFRSQPR